MIIFIKKQLPNSSMIKKTAFTNYQITEDKELDTVGVLVQVRSLPLNRAGKKVKQVIMPHFLILAKTNAKKDPEGYVRMGASVVFPGEMIGKKVRFHVEVVD